MSRHLAQVVLAQVVLQKGQSIRRLAIVLIFGSPIAHRVIPE